MRRPPEHRDQQGEEDEAHAQPVARDQAREAAVGDRPHRDLLLQHVAGEKVRRCAGGRAGLDVGRGRDDVERALQEVLRVGEELGADRLRGRGRGRDACALSGLDHDLLPADPPGIVSVAVRDRALSAELRPCEDDLEPGRAQPGLAGWESEHVAERSERRAPAVDPQVEVPADRAGEPGGVGGLALRAELRPRLDGRDLRQVEHVEDVEAVARGLHPAVPVDREVAQRVGLSRSP